MPKLQNYQFKNILSLSQLNTASSLDWSIEMPSIETFSKSFNSESEKSHLFVGI